MKADCFKCQFPYSSTLINIINNVYKFTSKFSTENVLEVKLNSFDINKLFPMDRIILVSKLLHKVMCIKSSDQIFFTKEVGFKHSCNQFENITYTCKDEFIYENPNKSAHGTLYGWHRK